MNKKYCKFCNYCYFSTDHLNAIIADIFRAKRQLFFKVFSILGLHNTQDLTRAVVDITISQSSFYAFLCDPCFILSMNFEFAIMILVLLVLFI